MITYLFKHYINRKSVIYTMQKVAMCAEWEIPNSPISSPPDTIKRVYIIRNKIQPYKI